MSKNKMSVHSCNCDVETSEWRDHEEYCPFYLGGEVAELQRQLAESEKLKQKYYNEAAEGWKKYRELMSVTHEPTEAAIQDIAFCLQ